MTPNDSTYRLALSAWAIVHLHEIGELSEGVAMKLMNSPDRVSYRLTREKCVKGMKAIIALDEERERNERVERAKAATAG